MADIKVSKEVVVGEVMKDDTRKYVVSVVESNIGKYVSATQFYDKDGEWKRGKGQWLPFELAEELGQLIVEGAQGAK